MKRPHHYFWIVVTTIILLVGCSKHSEQQLEHYLTRDVRDDVFYFVMPDRFYNGDKNNDNGSTTIAASSGGYDPTSSGHYHGGDIKGLIDKLDYIKDMGVTAIWLTPILRNQAVQGDSSGYHGYWPLDFTEIDPHLGTNEELKQFIDAAHDKNMKVFFDIITNHTADVIKYEECHLGDNPMFSTDGQLCEYKSLEQKAQGDRYTPFLPTNAEYLKKPDWLNDPQYYHNQGDSKWHGENAIYGDFMGLDDIDTDNPFVVNGMIDIFNQLIKEFKPDGFRVDTVKHVNIEFWQQFTPAIIKFAQSQGIPNFFVFGEVYSGDPKELSYYTTTGDMPSVLDFAFQFKTKEVFAQSKETKQLEWLFEQDSLYRDHNSDESLLMNFVSNHDVGRLAYTLKQQLPDVSEQEILKRIELANALMFFARGIPVIYYGDEQGFVGYGGDRGAREDMMPSLTQAYNDIDLLATDKTTADNNFDQHHPIYQMLQNFARIYKQHKTLRHGKQEVLHASDEAGVFAFTRTDEKNEYLLIFNSAKEAKVYQSPLPISKTILGSAEVNKQQIMLPALSFVILKK